MRAGPRITTILMLTLSCAEPEPAGAPTTTLPIDEPDTLPSINLEDTGTWVPQDTGGTVTNLDPEGTIRILQEGFWYLAPGGGPYQNMTGTLVVNEYPDGIIDTGADTAIDTAEPPACEVTFAMSGEVVEPNSCADCDVVFRVEWSVVEGDPSPCRDPDLPTDGSSWIMGYSSARDVIEFNYYGSGVWVDWYTTQGSGDTLRIEFDTTKAVAVEEDT